MSNARNLARLLPNSSGQLPDAAMASGSVLQVVESYDTYTSTYSGGSYMDLNGMSVTITPLSANSKFYLLASISYCIQNQNYSIAFRFTRNGTPVGIGDQVGSSRPRASFAGVQVGGGDHVLTVSQQYLDSPNSASSITYKVQGFAESGDFFITNRAYNSSSDANNAKQAVTMCKLTVMEIAG